MSLHLNWNLENCVRVMLLENEYTTIRHTHNFLEFVYVVSGTAEFQMGEYNGVLSAGNYFVVDYNTPHDYISAKGDLSIINCLFIPEFVLETKNVEQSFDKLCERYFMRVTGRRINGPTSNQIFFDNGKIGKFFKDMLKEYSAKQEGYLEILRFLLCRIIIETIRGVGSRNDISHSTEKILDIIENNYSSKLSLGEICQGLHYSLPYISTKFKTDTGYTFTDYLQRRRLEKSCRLLRETALPISSIAESVGYQNLKFFGTIFKRFTGLSPREYRKSNR